MPRRSRTEQELGYLRAFWDEVRTLQADYAAAVGMYAYPTDRPGIWSYRLVFTPLLGDAENRVGAAAVQFQYPNENAQMLAASFWTQAMKLTELVASGQEVKRPGRK